MDESKKKTLIGTIVIGVLFLGFLVFVILTQFRKPAAPKAEETITVVIPDGEAAQMPGSKRAAYQERRSWAFDAYFNELPPGSDDQLGSLVSPDPSARAESTVQERTGTPSSGASSEEASVARVFGQAPSSSPSETRRPSSGGRGYRSSPSSSMTQEERLDYDRRRAEMVRDVLTGGTEPPETPGPDAPEPTPSSPIDLSSVNSADGIISSLDDEFEDSSVGYGEGVKRPFKCMFVRDQKLTSGQRVTLRLLEDYNVDGVRIPANTHLSAICKIGDRLELSVRSLEMNGRIVPLGLDAYDTDGLPGIYCPETTTNKNSRSASRDAITAGTTTFGGLVGDLANTVLRTGASIAQNAAGEMSVSVVSGYEFYLVKSEKR